MVDENAVAEKDRFYSRLSLIPGVRPMHSIGDWILLQCEKPQDLARRVARRLDPTLVSVPRHIEGVVRVIVSDPKTNERLLRTIREAVVKFRCQTPNHPAFSARQRGFAPGRGQKAGWLSS